MFTPLKYSIGLILPTFVLLQGPSVSSEYLVKRELFGGDKYYLDLHFSKRPSPTDSFTPFKGFLSHEVKEEKISGVVQFRDRYWRYEFPTEKGKFRGVILREKNRCEPLLSYEIINTEGTAIEKGVLRGGFCS
jgi:hypothetical protein